jgi:equilibrative nucleoside transporter 1/2/3
MEEDAEQQLLSATPEPRDDYNAAYSVFFALGVGLILPWNAFISAVDYFQVLYPDAHTDRVFALAYMFPCLFTLVYLTFYCRKFSASSRINGGLTLFLAAIVLIPIVDRLLITGSQGSQATQYVTVGAGITMGIANAIMEGSLVGVAGELPERYMQAFVAGTAGSGMAFNLSHPAFFFFKDAGIQGQKEIQDTFVQKLLPIKFLSSGTCDPEGLCRSALHKLQLIIHIYTTS